MKWYIVGVTIHSTQYVKAETPEDAQEQVRNRSNSDLLNDCDFNITYTDEEEGDIDTKTPAGRLSSGIFAALADFESDLIRERTRADLAAALARGRKCGRNGGRPFSLTKTQVRTAQVAMADRGTSVAGLCKELGIRPVTLYRYVGPNGELRAHAKRVLQA